MIHSAYKSGRYTRCVHVCGSFSLCVHKIYEAAFLPLVRPLFFARRPSTHPRPLWCLVMSCLTVTRARRFDRAAKSTSRNVFLCYSFGQRGAGKVTATYPARLRRADVECDLRLPCIVFVCIILLSCGIMLEHRCF